MQIHAQISLVSDYIEMKYLHMAPHIERYNHTQISVPQWLQNSQHKHISIAEHEPMSWP